MGLLPTHLLNNPQKMLSMISQRQECFSQYLNNGVSSRLETNLIEKYGPSPIASSASGDSEQITTEEELAKMQQNYLLYNVAVRHLSSTITEIKTALNVSANG